MNRSTDSRMHQVDLIGPEGQLLQIDFAARWQTVDGKSVVIIDLPNGLAMRVHFQPKHIEGSA
jgi:hypothetical protein